jgi:Tol biopolymer transport system component
MNLVAGDTRGVIDVFVRDLGSGKTTRVSVDSHGAQGNNNSSQASISANGRYIAFHSTASNLVGGDTNGRKDVFVRDRNAGTTTRMSVGLHGGSGNGASSSGVISADGRFVAFGSLATNLVAGDTNGVFDVFVRGPLRP